MPNKTWSGGKDGTKADKTNPLAGAVAGSYVPSNDEFGTTTLTSSITNSATLTALPIASGASLIPSNFAAISPLPAPLAVLVDSEWFLVTVDRNASICAINKRGVFGTSRASHASGATVNAIAGIRDTFFIDSTFPTNVGNLYSGDPAATNIFRIILPPAGVTLTTPTGGAGNIIQAADGKSHIITLQPSSAECDVEVYTMVSTAGVLSSLLWTGRPTVGPDGLNRLMLIATYTTQNGNQWTVNATSDAEGLISGTGDPEGTGLYYGVPTIFRRKDGGAGTALYVKTTAETLDTGWVAYA